MRPVKMHLTLGGTLAIFKPWSELK